MTYATLTDLIDSFGESELIELTNLDNPSADTINEIKVDAILSQTDGFIEGYLSRVLPFPLDSENNAHYFILTILKDKAVDIARYRLESKGEVREDVRRRFEDVLKWLEMVAKGEIILWSEDGNISIDDGDNVILNKSGIAMRSQSRVFTKKGLNLYTRTWYRNQQ